LLLQHGIHHLHFEQWFFDQGGLQLADHTAAEYQLAIGLMLCHGSSRWRLLQQL
jgi:hypothetical protein